MVSSTYTLQLLMILSKNQNMPLLLKQFQINSIDIVHSQRLQSTHSSPIMTKVFVEIFICRKKWNKLEVTPMKPFYLRFHNKHTLTQSQSSAKSCTRIRQLPRATNCISLMWGNCKFCMQLKLQLTQAFCCHFFLKV